MIFNPGWSHDHLHLFHIFKYVLFSLVLRAIVAFVPSPVVELTSVLFCSVLLPFRYVVASINGQHEMMLVKTYAFFIFSDSPDCCCTSECGATAAYERHGCLPRSASMDENTMIIADININEKHIHSEYVWLGQNQNERRSRAREIATPYNHLAVQVHPSNVYYVVFNHCWLVYTGWMGRWMKIAHICGVKFFSVSNCKVIFNLLLCSEKLRSMRMYQSGINVSAICIRWQVLSQKSTCLQNLFTVFCLFGVQEHRKKQNNRYLIDVWR